MTGHTAVLPATETGVASIRDVAAAAGVSYQTVSRVINHSSRVSPETRKRVQAAISSLSYRPSRAARALARGQAASITVLTSNTSLYGYATTLGGIEQAARAANVGVAISVLAAASPAVVGAAVEQVSDPRSGSVIVLAFDDAGARALQAMPSAVPTAAAVESFVGRTGRAPARGAWVWFDELTAAAVATRHLLGLGHRNVQHLAIPSSTAVGDRQTGWQLALAEEGHVVPAAVSAGGWDAEAGHRAARQLLADPGVTAVLCGNDELALGVLRAAAQLGRRVPDDLSVVGFDDTPSAAYFTPALTTVRLDFAALGRRAFALLSAGLHGSDPPVDVVPRPQLIVRESAGPAPT